MRIVVGVTDNRWAAFLRDRNDLTEANFWQPSPHGFKALSAGEPFLFKTKDPKKFRNVDIPGYAIVGGLAARAAHSGRPVPITGGHLDEAQQDAVAARAGTHRLVVIEGAAGAGKTATLAGTRAVAEQLGHRTVIVTPTLKAARLRRPGRHRARRPSRRR